ncbi:hypothetical protein O4H49_19435 [Kiloniella laminariae]|uniref:Uncharacterized protein n=1 Tax=Kiloniella laminariae TaxID=454162 RepID=A0ABT4LPA3_9PROT|nr:hypothetical protein [Kiloniella laminariae]MCZ4282965.1 hypothetical protein [Kiloniella laminariae]
MKKKYYWRAAIGLGLALITGGISAASAGALTNVRDVKLNVSGLNYYSEQCGLSREVFERALFGAFNEGELRLTRSSAYWLHTKVTTIIFDKVNCVSNVEVVLYANTRYFNPATASEMIGRVEVWNNGGLYSSEAETHQVQVNNALHKMGTSLRDAWAKDQQ